MSEPKNLWPKKNNAKSIKQKRLASPPVLYALASALRPFEQGKNKYQRYRDFTRMDPELESALTRVALMASYAYKDVQVHAGAELNEREKALLRVLKEFDEKFNIKDIFFSVAYHLMRDGDDIYVGHFEDGAGLVQFQPLPIEAMTALNNLSQKAEGFSFTTYITGPRFYILNEASDNEQIFPENMNQRVFHFPLNNRAEIIDDIKGRKTLGVWSKSLLETAESRVLWKQAILIADILWRYRNVPREEHTLDLSMYDPSLFSGETQELRIKAAREAAQAAIDEYVTNISQKNVDQGYVHGQDVEIKYVEPQKTTWVDPNRVVDQINKSIFALTSVSEAAVSGGGTTTYAGELVIASYTILLPELIVYKIKRILLRILKEHVRRVNMIRENDERFTDEEIDSIDLKTSLILQLMQGELIRQMALMAATGVFDDTELRAMVGLDALTKEQLERIVTIAQRGRGGQFAQSLLDIVRSANQTTDPNQEPRTPESRSDMQET
jgi:hypothetical protein